MNNDRHAYLGGLIKNVSKSQEAKAKGDGALGAKANNSATAKSASIEGNESAKYEKLEKRSLRSLKGGGTDKELRDGHNMSTRQPVAPGRRPAAPKPPVVNPGAKKPASKPKASGEKWIAKATENKGGLHRSLGVPAGDKIPKAKVAKAAAKGGKVGKQARLAQTLSKMKK